MDRQKVLDALGIVNAIVQLGNVSFGVSSGDFQGTPTNRFFVDAGEVAKSGHRFAYEIARATDLILDPLFGIDLARMIQIPPSVYDNMIDRIVEAQQRIQTETYASLGFPDGSDIPGPEPGQTLWWI